MNILWLAWKDSSHPQQGGAELVMNELIDRQVRDGHNVTILTAQYPGSKAEETLANGVHVIRIGRNRYAHPFQALMYYLRHLRNRFDLVIETVNTAPYFSLLFRGKAKGLAFYHQLARDIWFFETKPPISHMGFYLLEPLATWLLGRAKAPLVTISNSTKQDLARFGWNPKRTHIISEGIRIAPLEYLEGVTKYNRPTMLSLGALRGMKRTIDQVKAFELAKPKIPNLQLKIAGDASDPYGKEVLAYIEQSPYRTDIEYLGRVSDKEKRILMQKAHVITVTSVKEGWGLIVTEANSQGTPAIVYDVDGLRDSVRDGDTGFVTRPTPEALAKKLIDTLSVRSRYLTIRHNAWQWSKQLTFDQSYQDFKQVIQETTA